MLHTPVFGLALSTLAWCAGCWVRKKTGFALCNPLLIASALVIVVLVLTGIPYESYALGGDLIGAMLGPVTVVLAVNVYDQRRILGKHFLPVVAGCLAGSLTSLGCVSALCRVLELDPVLTASMLPKSCTSAIAIGIAESRGGLGGIAVLGVMAAGLTGAVFAPLFVKLLRVKDPVAQGVGIGACSHALGTARAMEMGRLQGAMSSVAICLSGVMSCLLVLFL